MRRTTLSILALTVVATAACGPDDDRPWDDDPDRTVVVTPEMRAQFTALRTEVDSVVLHLRDEVEIRQQGVTGDTLEAWTDTSTRVADRRRDLLLKLDELDRASLDEARDIRNDVANELAELEADVVRQRLRLEGDHQAALQAFEEHLGRLEQDLDLIEARARSLHGVPAARTGVEGAQTQEPRAMTDAATQRQTDEHWDDDDRYDHVPDMDEIRDIREDIQEARRDAAEVRMSTGDDRRDRVEDLSDQVADLTREIRKHWYNVRYTFTAADAHGDMDRERMDDTQY